MQGILTDELVKKNLLEFKLSLEADPHRLAFFISIVIALMFLSYIFYVYHLLVRKHNLKNSFIHFRQQRWQVARCVPEVR